MALTIYGTHRSRTMRVLWTAAELGLDYTHVPLAVGDPGLREPWYLRIHPAGQIPAIVDDGFALSESLAINLYLARKYGPTCGATLHPTTLEEEADAWRWSLWAQAHVEPWVQKDARLAGVHVALAATGAAEVTRALDVLERHVSENEWLVGGRFTVADINVASVLSPSRARHIDFAPYPATHDWLSRCRNRPAAVATRQRFPA